MTKPYLLALPSDIDLKSGEMATFQVENNQFTAQRLDDGGYTIKVSSSEGHFAYDLSEKFDVEKGSFISIFEGEPLDKDNWKTCEGRLNLKDGLWRIR